MLHRALLLSLLIFTTVAFAQELLQPGAPPSGGPNARWIVGSPLRWSMPAGELTSNDWRPQSGQWRGASDETSGSRNPVLEMSQRDAADPFNLILAADTRYRNLDLAVKIKSVSGQEDQGGGLVWHALDARNYYVARFNPLEGDLALFKIVNGQRDLLQSVLARPKGPWVRLRIVTAGPRIWGYLDDDLILDASDDALPGSGAIGLWTKADAVTRFDDFRASPFSPPDTRADQAKVLFMGFHDRSVDSMAEASAELDLPVRMLTINEGDTPGTTLAGMNNLDYSQFDVIYVLHIPETEGHALVPRFHEAKKANPKLRIVMLDARPAADKELLDAGVMDVDPQVTAYWKGMGPENLKRLLTYTKVKYLGGHGEVRPPITALQSGFYHPDLPRPLSSWQEFDAWQKRRSGFAIDAPLVVMFVQQDYVVYDNHAVYDAMVRAIEPRGIRVAAMFGPTAELQRLLRECKPNLIMLQHHQGPEESAKDGQQAFLEQLGVPYLFCSGMVGGLTVDDWQSDVRGVKRGRWYGEMARHELFGIIEPFLVGMRGATAYGFSLDAPVPERVARFADRVASWLKLQRTPSAQKKLAVIYFHHTLGRSDVGRPAQEMARYFDPIASLVKLLDSLKQAGYHVDGAPTSNETLLQQMQTSGRNVASWSPGDLDTLVRDGKPVLIPETQYLDWYKHKLSPQVQAIVERAHGPPPGKLMVIEQSGQKFIVLPAMTYGNVVVAPQPDRGGMQDQALLHSRTAPPPHNYLAFYFWLQEGFKADAVIHFGTHGSEFYLPGKEIFLGPDDFPDIILGALPNFDIWTVTNVGEALIAKRRSYGVIVDHLTPPLLPTTRNADAQALTDLIDRLQQASASPTRASLLDQLNAAVRGSPLAAEAGVRLNAEQSITDSQLSDLSVHLHHLGTAIYQQGMHVLGTPPTTQRALDFVTNIVLRNTDLEQKLRAAGVKNDVFARARTLIANLDQAPPNLSAEMQLARRSLDALNQTPDEIKNLLAGLSGKYVPPGPGGDALARPDALPTGRNIYGLSPAEIPSKQAWQLARKLTDSFLATYAAKNAGRSPTQLAFTLTGMETFRDMGVMEAQVLHLIGVRPTWNAGGTVVDLALIPLTELGRPRVDVALSVNAIYLKNFPQCLRLLDEAIRLVNAADEPGNIIRAHTADNNVFLLSRGMPSAKAADLAGARIYGGAPGDNTARLIFMLPRSGTWQDRTDILNLWRDTRTNVFTDTRWGEAVPELHDRVYTRTDAILSNWSDNLLGPLTNHHWSEETGGLAMSVGSLAGKKIPVTVLDLRRRDDPVASSLEETLSLELRSLALNRDWIAGQMEHGYTGATQFMQITDNVFRWDAVRDGALPNAAWTELIDVYVHDKMNLGLRGFFEKNNPHALQDMAATLLEASRKGYWQADPSAVREIAALYADSVARFGASGGPYSGGNTPLRQYVTSTLNQPGDAPLKQTYLAKLDASETPSEAAPMAANIVSGQRMVAAERSNAPATRSDMPPASSLSERTVLLLISAAVMVLAVVGFRFKVGAPRNG